MRGKRIALVTGASRGIGLAIACRLAEEGCFVVAVDKAPAGKGIPAGAHCFYKADIGSESQVLRLFARLQKDYGRLDVLVNNAGIIADNMIWKMSAADFDKVIRINLRGTWLMCREAAKMMRAQEEGRIINIASRAWLGNRGQSNYSASKAGVVGMTRVLALELGRFNVSANCVAPGLIDTPMTQSLSPEALRALLAKQPSGKMGKPEDVANAVAFLAAERTRFITGQTIYIDGGRSIGAA